MRDDETLSERIQRQLDERASAIEAEAEALEAKAVAEAAAHVGQTFRDMLTGTREDANQEAGE